MTETIAAVEPNIIIFFALLILLVKSVSQKDINRAMSRLSAFILAVECCVLANTFVILINEVHISVGRLPGFLAMLAYLLLVACVGFQWMEYSFSLRYDPAENGERGYMFLQAMAATGLMIYTLLCAASYRTGQVFSIDENGFYSRGPLWFLEYLLPMIYDAIVVASACINIWKIKTHTPGRGMLELRYEYTFAFFYIPIVIAAMFQTYLQGSSISVGLGLSTLYVYMEMATLSSEDVEQRDFNRLLTDDLQKRVREQQASIGKDRETLIDVISVFMEMRGIETRQQIRTVRECTGILAGEVAALYPEYGLTEEKVGMIVSVSAVRDVGKAALPESILFKEGRLTTGEFEEMKTHPVEAGRMLCMIEDAWGGEYSKICSDVCRYHHERFDGGGYPDRLKGESIPVSAQIVSVADALEELIHGENGRAGCTPSEACDRILSGECGSFNPKLLLCLRNRRDEIERALAEEQ